MFFNTSQLNICSKTRETSKSKLFPERDVSQLLLTSLKLTAKNKL